MLALKFFLSCPLDIPSMLTLQPPWTLSTAQTCASPSSHPCEQAACSGPEHTVHSVINKPPHPRKHIRRKSVREHDATLSVPADTRRPSINEIPCEVMSKTRRLTRTEDSRTQLGGTGASCSKPQKPQTHICRFSTGPHACGVHPPVSATFCCQRKMHYTKFISHGDDCASHAHCHQSSA
jgi:hypothetical protein